MSLKQFDFKESKLFEKTGKKIGYVFSLFISTTILFFILTFLDKLPSLWSYFYVMAIIFLISLVGIILKHFLK